MPQPNVGMLHVDRPMTNLLIGYKNPLYIVDDICPSVMVPKRTDIIPRLNQSHFFRDDARKRAANTRSARGGWTADNTMTYYCDRYSYGHEIPDEVRDNTDLPYDQDREATQLVGDKLTMCRERSFASNYFTTGIWGQDKVGDTDFNKWSNYAGSTPLEDIGSYKDSVEALVGMEPNTFVMGKQVWVGSGGLVNGTGLKWHPELLDTIKYTQRAQLSIDLFASLIEVEKVLMGRSIFTSSPEGISESSVSYSRIWGKHALMLFNPPGPSIWKPAAIMTIVWARVANALQYVKRLRNEENEYEVLDGTTYFSHKQIVANAGLFMSNVVN